MLKIIHFRTLFRTKLIRSIPYLSIFLAASSCISDPVNRPSPLRIEKGKVGGVSIELNFSSPAVRNRKIFGYGPNYLEQYDELWRTGANKATTIAIDKPVLIDSFLLDSGKYSIFTIPGREKWTVIFNKDWDQWGSYNYKDSQDVFRIQLIQKKLSERHERMKLFIESDSLKFVWDKTAWSVVLASLP